MSASPPYRQGFEFHGRDSFAANDRSSRDETHFSAFEPCPQASSRIPCTHGHQSGSQDPELATRAWSRQAERLSLTPHTAETDMHVKTAAPDKSEAALLAFFVLKKRADFLKAARARRVPCEGFLLQARQRAPGESLGVRVGFTCSKKVGNAVARNRAKRRLREISRLVLPGLAQDGWDYVLIGRLEKTAWRDFAELQNDLRRALRKVHGPKP
jgi:ribonuclease P protein component